MFIMVNMHVVNLRSVDLNLLTVLHALLIEESVSRAAARVHLSQPATSHALSRLRDLFHDPLLERRGGRLRRTAFGSGLMPRVNAAIQATTAVFTGPGPLDLRSIATTMRIAASDYVSTLLLPTVLRDLSTQAPGLELRVTVTDRVSVSETLKSGGADLALGVFGRSTPGFLTEGLFDDDFVILARSGHPILETPELAARDLVHHDWLLVSPFGDPVGPVDEALRGQGLSRPVRLTVPSFLQAPQVAASTNLVVALGRRLAAVALEHWPLGTRELPLPVPGFRANTMWLSQRNGDPLLEWVRSRFRDAAQQEADGRQARTESARRTIE